MQKHKPSTSYRRHRPIYERPLFYLFVLAVLVLVAFFILRQPQEPKSTKTPTATTSKQSEQKKTGSAASESKTTAETDASTDASVSPDGKTPEKYEGADPNASGSITGAITAARFSSDKLIIRVNIDQYLSSGTCTLTLSDGTNQLTKTANLVPVASTSSCEGFDIQSSELSNFSRPITININLASSNKAGTITGRVE